MKIVLDDFDFDMYDLKPKKFYSYPHSVINRFINIEFENNKDYIELEMSLIELFNKAGMKARSDNKIVFEVQNST